MNQPLDPRRADPTDPPPWMPGQPPAYWDPHGYARHDISTGPPAGWPADGGPPPGLPPTARPPRRPRRWPLVLTTVLLAMVVVVGGVWADAFGVRERIEHLAARVDLVLHPPADRTTAPTVDITPQPGEIADDAADPSLGSDLADAVEITPEPDPTAALASPTTSDIHAAGPATTDPSTPDPTATPRPRRRPVHLTLRVADPGTMFAPQVEDTMCAAAGMQMVLAMHGHAGTSPAFQRKLQGRLDEWESRSDAKAGGWGPGAMVEALAAYGVKGYQARAYVNRNQALRDAAIAMTRTGAPAILIAWRGAHTWVMTGYTADADPTLFGDARITGVNIFDPWYPRISSIWGPSDPPGTLQDVSEIRRNFLQWQRPEGSYPGRDGKYLIVIPTIPLRDQLGTAAR